MSDIDERVMVQMVDSSKLTVKLVLSAMKSMYEYQKMNHRENQREKQHMKHKQQQAPKTGKQTLKELMQQNRQLTFVPLEEQTDLRRLQKELKQYAVDFSVVKEGKTKWQIFFKAQDAEIFNQAFKKVLSKFDSEFQKVNQEKMPEQDATSKGDQSKSQKNRERESEPKHSMEKQTKNRPLSVNERLEKAKREAQTYNQAVQKEPVNVKRRKKNKEVER
ncbi:PcfB family protein [Enterococcus olivae]